METLASKTAVDYCRLVYGKTGITNRTECFLEHRMVIQELLAERKKERRVFVVNINTRLEDALIHDR